MELLSGIGLVAAAIGSIVGIMEGCKKFCQYVVIPIKQHFEMVHQSFASIEALKADLASLKKKIDYELNPNGGGSLKDQVKSTARLVARLECLTLTVLDGSTEHGIWISDEHSQLVWNNQFYSKRLGWDLADMISMGWKNTILESERDRVAKGLLDSAKDGRDFIMSFSYIHKDDASKTLRVHAQCRPLKRNNGEVIGYIGFATELKDQ